VGKQKFKNKAVLLRAETIEFNCAMDYARLIVQDTSNKKEQIVLLEFMLNVVRADLKVDILSTIFYSEENFERVIGFPFPNEYYDEMGTELKLHPKGETAIKTSVDLANECVLVLSWDRKSMKHGILNVYKYGFTFDKRDHIAEYYSYVNICYVYNGNHSIASGIVQKKGVLQANKYDVSKLFEHVHTDGVFWYNSHNNQKLGNVFDFRVSIIYEIAKLKHQIEQGE
jgi:hypothetical protein